MYCLERVWVLTFTVTFLTFFLYNDQLIMILRTLFSSLLPIILQLYYVFGCTCLITKSENHPTQLDLPQLYLERSEKERKLVLYISIGACCFGIMVSVVTLSVMLAIPVMSLVNGTQEDWESHTSATAPIKLTWNIMYWVDTTLQSSTLILSFYNNVLFLLAVIFGGHLKTQETILE